LPFHLSYSTLLCPHIPGGIHMEWFYSMNSTWIPYIFTWIPCISTWIPCNSRWIPYIFTWIPYIFTWIPYIFTWIPYIFTWIPYIFSMDSIHFHHQYFILIFIYQIRNIYKKRKYLNRKLLK